MRGVSVKHLMMGLLAVTIAFTSGIVHADPDRPSPLKGGVLMPFPWENIGGVWQIDDPSQDSVFSFEVKKTQDGNKVLEVVQVDENGAVIARGAGVAIPGDKNTVSVMMAGEGQEPYMLYVRHVREKKYSRNKMTVVTIKPLSSPDRPSPLKPERNYKLERLSAAPLKSWEREKEQQRY